MGDLYWGDNLNILRDYIADASVDLIYLDPPFNSNRNYNVLFKDNDRHDSDAQIEAFTDTWHWGEQAEAAYAELVHGNRVPQRVSDLIAAMRSFIGSNDVMAYLVMMTLRLLELHRVLKPTGSIYLHCDPTASHYLKVVMDTIWGPRNFRNEIVWKRSSAHSDTRQGGRHYGRISDTLLFYAKGDNSTWNQQYIPYDQEYIDRDYRRVDENGRRYRIGDLSGPGGAAKGNPYYEVMGVSRYWRFSKEHMDELVRQGRVIQTRPGAVPQYIRYLDEMPGVPLQNIWADLPGINNRSKEMLGYPTQKPLALLERIIATSSNPGDLVLDPFCGCGTAIAAAEKLGRRWVGIDVTHLAITLILSRMKDMFPGVQVQLHGEPADVGGAYALAQADRYDFQYWALTLVGARPLESKSGDKKKGADRGIDGIITFLGADQKTPHRCVVQVKSGHVNSGMIRDLKGTVEREKAELGLLITLEDPSGPMKLEALQAGYYHSAWMDQDYPKLQILTVGELLKGTQPKIPPRYNPYQLAPVEKKPAAQAGLFERGA